MTSITLAVKQVNRVLSTSMTSPADREIVCQVTEIFLQSCKQYNGYRLLYAHEVPTNQLPGTQHPSMSDRGVDETRREYLIG